jgi:hypothetical protein
MLRITLFVLSSMLFICSIVSCGLHTEELSGAGHVAGYDYPVQNCTECHGNDLRGDNDAPSCFACHDQKWE